MTAIPVSDYLTEAAILARWPMLTPKELRKARRQGWLGFYAFRNGPCSTSDQVQAYIDFLYLNRTSVPCAAAPVPPQAPTQAPLPGQPRSPLPAAPDPEQPAPPMTPSSSTATTSPGPIPTMAASSMPAGMTPELAASAAARLGQRIGRRRKSSLPPSSSPSPRPQAAPLALIR